MKMKLCKTCNKIINSDLIAQSIWSIKQQCMECSSIQVKAVSLEEYEEMKQKETRKSTTQEIVSIAIQINIVL